MDKNFGLSPSDFDQLVSNLKRNETDFFERVFLRHFEDCINFLQKQQKASYNDAYDASMDALIQFRRLLVEGKLKHGNLRYLFTKMASQIYVKNIKKFQLQDLSERDMEVIQDTDPITTEENIALLNVVWKKLAVPCQELLKLHYYSKMKLTEIAEYQEKTPTAIRKQKERCIAEIRKIIKKRKDII